MDWAALGGTELTIAVYLVSLGFVALAAACETALQQTGLFRLRKMLGASQKQKAAEVSWDEKNQAHLLFTVQALHLVTLLLLGGLQLTLLSTFFPSAWGFGVGICLSLLLVLAIEVLVRSHARAHADDMAKLLLPVGLGLARLATPLFWVLNLLMRPFLPKTVVNVSLADDLEELSEDVRLLQTSGLLEQD